MNYKLIKPKKIKEVFPFIKKFKTKNIIIDLSKLKTNLNKNEILIFKEIAINKKENSTSFIIIDTNIEELEEVNVVPTLQEAIDIIEIDEMIRDLE
ncbi:MAG: ribonuclease Z [Flavobacteriaceae bacterium]|nr:ribonuclease Z [Flavobacteriaceae bacterium]